MKSVLHGFDGRAFRRSFSQPVVTRSLTIAIIVGTILNVINQGDALLGGGNVNVFKLVLTYAVPFFVASYGAYSAFRHLDLVDEQD